MSLSRQIRRRRFRRLCLALVAALLCHIGLILSGDWGIHLFSAPSNEDRVLTLSLEHTPYEGLKETEQEAQETINTPDLGLAKTIEPTPQELADDNDSKPLMAAPEEQVSTADQVDERAEQALERNLPIQENPIQGVSAAPNENQVISVTESDVKIQAVANNSSEPEPLVPQEMDIAPAQKEMLVDKLEKLANKIKAHEDLPESLTWEEQGQSFEAKFRHVPASDDMATDELLVEVSTEQDGEYLSTSLRLKKLAFSNFAQFVHQWDEDTLMHDDEMNGRFHSNTQINVANGRDGGPVFRGKVTTASYSINMQGRGARKKIFLGGLETGVKRIRMPKPRMLFANVPTDKPNTIIIEHDARLIFTEDGYFAVQYQDQEQAMRQWPIGERPLYIIAAPKVSLSVSGVVNGSVAVYSPRRITIDGDIRYASVNVLEKGGDFLGLVSGRSVMIAGRKAISEGDLTVHASIYARSRFGVKDLLGKRAGTLNILGSVSAGTLTPTEPRYATKVYFDNRLEDVRPPGFPVTDRYELLAAEHNWQVQQDPYHESFSEPLIEQLDPSLEPL